VISIVCLKRSALALAVLAGCGGREGPADFTSTRGTTYHLGTRAGDLLPSEVEAVEAKLEHDLAQFDQRYTPEVVAEALSKTTVTVAEQPPCPTCGGDTFINARGYTENYIEFRANARLFLVQDLNHEELHVIKRFVLGDADGWHCGPEWRIVYNGVPDPTHCSAAP